MSASKKVNVLMAVWIKSTSQMTAVKDEFFKHTVSTIMLMHEALWNFIVCYLHYCHFERLKMYMNLIQMMNMKIST